MLGKDCVVALESKIGRDLYKVKVMPGNNPGSAVVKSNDKLARLLS